MKRVILTTGGTGGHIFPALAVAEEIKRRYPDVLLLFIGGTYGQEADLAVKAGLDFTALPVRGVMGRGLKGIGAAFAMLSAVGKAMGIMRKFKPDAVIGFGGYAAFAGVLGARLCGVPTAIHEQNSYPGMTNRLLGKVVDTVFLSMPDSAGAFPTAKSILVGNPVRAGIAALYEERVAQSAKEEAAKKGTSYYGGVDGPSPFDVAEKKKAAETSGKNSDAADAAATAPEGSGIPGHTAAKLQAQGQARPPRLLVMGGSLGARAINDGMAAAIEPLCEAGIEVRHQTGQADYERVRAAYREAKADNVRVEAFINDMPAAYSWADAAFCRAGASTLAEITAAGLPAVLAPFPKAAQDHQRHNARYLEAEEAAIILEQKDFLAEPKRLADTLIPLLKDKERLCAMGRQSLSLAKPYAASSLVDELERRLLLKKGAEAVNTPAHEAGANGNTHTQSGE